MPIRIFTITENNPSLKIKFEKALVAVGFFFFFLLRKFERKSIFSQFLREVCLRSTKERIVGKQ